MRERPGARRAVERLAGRRAQEKLREEHILRAAIEVLALTDYGGMTIDAVAARAGVNKTTIYRKWQTKAELVRAGLTSLSERVRFGISSGDLRSDLLRVGHQIRAFVVSIEGRSLMRLRILEHPEPELAEIAADLQERQRREVLAMMEAAVARKELGRDVDILLLLDMYWGALYARLVMRNEEVDDATLARMVDVLMIAAGPARRLPRSTARTPRRT